VKVQKGKTTSFHFELVPISSFFYTFFAILYKRKRKHVHALALLHT
jgi:hypothetical protein